MLENAQAKESVARLIRDRKTSAGWRRAITSAYQDDFWGGADKSVPDGATWSFDDYAVKAERNALRGWVSNYIAAVMYSRVTPSVFASPLAPLPPEIEAQAAEATKTLLDEWFNGQPGTMGGIAAQMKLSVRWNLLYGHTAFKYTLDGPEGPDPRAMIRLTVAPRWEVDWDPRKPSARDLQAYLHVYPMARDKVLARWPDAEDKIKSLPASDQPLEKDDTQYRELLKSEVMIAEWTDLSENYVVDPKDERRDPDADPEAGPGPDVPAPPIKGLVRWFLLSGETIVCELESGPAPIDDVDGQPLSGLVPCILTPAGDEPCRGIPGAATPYNIERTINFLRTWQANAGQQDMARKYAIPAGAFDEDNKAKLLNGRDGEFVEYAVAKAGDPARPVVAPVVPSPTPETVAQLNATLEADRQLTASSLSDQVSNDETKYFTATQAAMVGSYAENEIGEMRQTMDQIVVELMRCFLRALRQSMIVQGIGEFAVKLADGTVVPYPREWLDHPWQLGVSDLANTPMAEGSKQEAFTRAFPMIQAAAMSADYGLPGPISAAAGLAAIEYMQSIFKLPDTFKPAALFQRAATLPPPPPPPAPAGAEAGGEEEVDDGGEGEDAVAAMATTGEG